MGNAENYSGSPVTGSSIYPFHRNDSCGSSGGSLRSNVSYARERSQGPCSVSGDAALRFGENGSPSLSHERPNRRPFLRPVINGETLRRKGLNIN